MTESRPFSTEELRNGIFQLVVNWIKLSNVNEVVEYLNELLVALESEKENIQGENINHE